MTFAVGGLGTYTEDATGGEPLVSGWGGGVLLQRVRGQLGKLLRRGVRGKAECGLRPPTPPGPSRLGPHHP